MKMPLPVAIPDVCVRCACLYHAIYDTDIKPHIPMIAVSTSIDEQCPDRDCRCHSLEWAAPQQQPMGDYAIARTLAQIGNANVAGNTAEAVRLEGLLKLHA